MNKRRITAAILEQVRAAAGPCAPVVAVDLPLGPGGIAADLAVLGDEFLGVAVRGASDPISDLSRCLELYARRFERVVLVVAPDHVPRVDPSALRGATVWICGEDGRLAEHRADSSNHVGLNARFDLLTIDERRFFLERLIVSGAIKPRGPDAVPVGRMRDLFAAVFTARHGRASDAFWTAARDRAIGPGDLGLLGRLADRRDVILPPGAERCRATG